MLQTLNIENVALIEKTTLEFDNKLNVITGETGAGKSIMLDALSFVFGGRADKTLIRSGCQSMKVEAIFSCVSERIKQQLLEDLDLDVDDEIFVSRELDLTGRNVCKINGELVPVTVVKKACQLLIDLHGQSEHLAILSNDYQLKIIDLFSKKSENLLKNLGNLIEKLKNIENSIKELGGSEAEKQNLIDLYSYQIEEIKNADIKQNEYEDLVSEKKEIQSYEKINTCLKDANEVLSKGSFESSVTEKLNDAIRSIRQIVEVNDHYKELASRLDSSLIELQDISDTINDDLNSNIFDQERFDYVDSRIDFIKTLFRKYGGDYEKLNEYYLSIQTKFDNLINGQEKYNELTKEKDLLLEKIDKAQDELSEERKKSADLLKADIEKELKLLGMPNAKLDIEFSRIQERFTSFGYDHVEFMISLNLGFELRPLNKVVSGGEMSRVMLAYKIVVSQVDDIQTIIFDEIDSGLSGEIASVVAKYMARLSLNKQIIAVSHLPQICAMADRNVKVEKYSDDVTTHTKSTVLNEQETYIEIARLMGAEADEKGIMVSKALKGKSEQYKLTL